MFTRVVAVGRLTKDPELRTTTSGKSVVSFTIAVNKRVKSSDGSDADFFRVTAWGQTADYVNNYLTKGRLVSVDGRLETKKWNDQQGNSRESIEIVADNVNGLDRPRDDDQGGSPPPRPAGRSSAPPAPAADDYDPWLDA